MAGSASFEEVRDFLFSLKNQGSRYGIDRMRLLSAALGHPERAFPCIHVAGTNGKGSTSAMIEAILRAHGLRTGLYTSPHLVHLGERVQVNRIPLTGKEILDGINRLRPVADRLVLENDPDAHPSFFEFMTALAFETFRQRQVDAAIIEVGLGGRLDATNVLTPAVTVITSIGLDHQEQLGPTRAHIAREKAGILKPGVPLILGLLPTEAEAEILPLAAQLGCPVTRVADTFGPDLKRAPVTNLAGSHQRSNAACALLAARHLLAGTGHPFDENLAYQALAQVVWAGRWDVRQVGDHTVILDASHNEEGARTLDELLGQLVTATGRKPAVLTAILGESRARALLPVLARHAREVHVTSVNQPRATLPSDLALWLRQEGFTGNITETTVNQAFPNTTTCALGHPGETVVVSGSLYLLGEVLERLAPTPAENFGPGFQDRP